MIPILKDYILENNILHTLTISKDITKWEDMNMNEHSFVILFCTVASSPCSYYPAIRLECDASHCLPTRSMGR